MADVRWDKWTMSTINFIDGAARCVSLGGGLAFLSEVCVWVPARWNWIFRASGWRGRKLQLPKMLAGTGGHKF